MMRAEKRTPEIDEARGALTQEERESIKIRADLRRRQFEFKRNVEALSKEESGPEAARVREGSLMKTVFREAEGEFEAIDFDEDTQEKIASMLFEAIKSKDTLPNLAAYNFAKAAKTQLAAGVDYRHALEQARELIARSQRLPKSSPSALLPEAIILGIEKQMLRKLPEVPPRRVAEALVDDPDLARDYALTLPDERRAEFMGVLPEDKRVKIGALMDKELAGLLPEKLIAGEAEARERQAVLKRAEQELKNLIGAPADTAERVLTRTLAETLSRLEGEDVKRVLSEIGSMALVGERESKKHQTKISYAARVLKTLSDIDASRGGNLTLKFLGKKDLPEKFFTYFSKRLTQDGFLTKNAEKYLRDKKNLPFLRKLVAQYPNQFNTVVDTLSQLRDYAIPGNEQEIFGAIEDLETLTPIIFDRYRRAEAVGKKELARRIRELKPKFFRNVPVKDILPKKDRDILAEMIYLSYKPIGMSFLRVKELVGKLADQTEDLADYKFPPEGYDFALTSKKTFAPRQGERIDLVRIQGLKEALSGSYPEKEEEIKKVSLLLGRLAKAGTDFKPDELQSILALFSRDEQVVDFVRRYPVADQGNVYGYLTELKEIFGIYFKDNFGERLANFLGANPTTAAAVAKILANPERIKTLKLKLGKDGEDLDWGSLDHLEISRDRDLVKAGELFSKFMLTKVLKSARAEIAKDVNKFEEREGGEAVSSERAELKAHVSKNIGSFFAKASAGICTAEDIPLFERNDHFHINIVERESQVRGNIQAYIIKDDGGQSLALRGFNPNTDFLERTDAASFTEKVIEIGRRFARDNNLRKVYITEQGDWHALSNREKVVKYLSRYLKEAKRKFFDLQVSSGVSVRSIYEV